MVGERYLLFVPAPHGYELVEREGEVPPVGSEVEADGGRAYVVTKLAPSPLPGDTRRCAYVQHAP
jgi:hypothetical protein